MRAAEIRPAMDDLGRALEQSDEALADVRRVMQALSKFDEAAIRRLLREEGVLIRLKAQKGDRDGQGSGGSEP